MLKFLLALVAVPGVILSLATATAAQTLPPNLPMAITCYAQKDQSWHIGYLDSVLTNGDAIYMRGGGRLAARVNPKGVVLAPTDRPSVLDCFGKTVDELRAMGRVTDFQLKR
jgi:hypothetical protein